MKKISVLLTLAVLMVSSSVFAGSYDYLSNQSAKYLMTLNRNAATDESADLAFYNPAATAFFGQGFYIDVSNQTLFTDYKETTATDTYKENAPIPLLPNVYAVYNFGEMGAGKLAVYGQVGVTAGGGTLKWDDGLAANALISSAETTSIYYVFNAGVAYSLLGDMVSINAGGKVIYADRNIKADINALNAVIDFDYTATGYTGVIGLDVKPVKELTLTARYELETALKFKYDDNSNTVGTAVAASLAGWSDGMKANENLPAVLSLGAEYAVTPVLSVAITGNMYFMSKADSEGAEKLFGTGWEAGIGATYKVMPELKVGLGYLYTDQGAKSKLYSDSDFFLVNSANPVLDSHAFGLGATYTVIPNLDITLTGEWTHYISKDYTVGSTSGTYKKEIYDIGLGASYKI